MRRCVAILLLALLPFQSSWAAVAAYCGHDMAAQAQHLGQHEHQHAGHDAAKAAADTVSDVESDGASDLASGAPSSGDCDCSHCHCHGSCCSLLAAAEAPVARTVAVHPTCRLVAIERTLASSPPERPQWLRLA